MVIVFHPRCLLSTRGSKQSLTIVSMSIFDHATVVAAILKMADLSTYQTLSQCSRHLCMLTRAPQVLQRALKRRKYMRYRYQTKEAAMTAVQQNGFALQYVPEALRTPALCLAAVQQCREALQYVPESHK